MSVGGTVHDRSDHADTPSQHHPAVARLLAELDAARVGIVVLDELDAPRRERVVAELRTAVPDLASRAAHEAGAEHVVATIRAVADRAPDGDGPGGAAATGLWEDIVHTAVEAARAVGRPEPVTLVR